MALTTPVCVSESNCPPMVWVKEMLPLTWAEGVTSGMSEVLSLARSALSGMNEVKCPLLWKGKTSCLYMWNELCSLLQAKLSALPSHLLRECSSRNKLSEVLHMVRFYQVLYMVQSFTFCNGAGFFMRENPNKPVRLIFRTKSVS